MEIFIICNIDKEDRKQKVKGILTFKGLPKQVTI